MIGKSVTIVTMKGNGRRYPRDDRQMAAGQGFEPQLPGPEPGVLPLDDPATGALSLAGQGFRSLGWADREAVHGHETLLGFGVDTRDDLDVRLEPRAP